MPAKKTSKVVPAKAIEEKQEPGMIDDKAALKLKVLLDRVAEKSGAKKKDIKPVVDAMLLVLGEALVAGESLILPPLGRLRVNRTKELVSGDVLILKLKRAGVGKAAPKARQERLADQEE